MLLAAVFCLPGTADASNVSSSLVVGIQSYKTQTFTPLDPVERDIISVYDLVYESLVTIDDNYIPQGQLALNWEESNNGGTWKFALRKEAKFSDGTPLTAKDVVASAKYILDKANTETPGFYFNLKYFIKDIYQEGDYTVVVKSDRKYYGLLYAMTFPVVPADQINSDFPLGSGAYKLADFKAGSYILLNTNPHWWQTQPQVKEIMFNCASNSATVIENFEYGRVDAIFTRDTAASQYKSSTTTFALDSRTLQLETLLINNASYPFDDVNIRKAVRMLIDVDKIASTVYFGMATRTDTPMPANTWMYNDSLSSHFALNFDEAVRILEDAGWYYSEEEGCRVKPKEDGSGTHRLSIRLYVYEEPDNDVRVEVANMISDFLTAAGFEIRMTTMKLYGTEEEPQMAEKLKAGSYDLALVAYSMDMCPDPGFLLMSGNTGNYVRYRSETMTNLCKELRTQTTQDGFKRVLDQIQLQFAEDCPFICLYYRDGAVLTRKMYTTVRDIREYELLRGIELFHD